MEESGMTEKELMDQTIREYSNLQRIKKAADRDKELEYQERILKARLQSMGIPTENLEL
ncbi:MAG: hypothetical protein LUI13_05135 [Lachnospiraceae bacterium]|nr:hypothetical protein [Lachnospiraceae bacterium]